MSPAPVELPGGTVLERRYRVDEVLARGGMSVVHRGVDLRLDRPVAIKVLDRALAEDPAFVRRFEREARSAARLAHPGIVAVHDQGRDADGTIFLVLELVEGGTLRDVLREHGRLRPAMALTVVEQVVAALRVAHARGLVHRDVKPENVLISREGLLKVADFGLVGAAWAADGGGAGEPEDPDDPVASDEMILGTVAYLSPEQVADGHADERSDLYAAGVVLFELLTGAPPHQGESAVSVAYAHVQQDIPPPSMRVAGIPRALDRLVVSMTRRDPDDRPTDAAAFLAAAREVRVSAELPFLPAPVPLGTPSAAPRGGGTRLLERDDESVRESLVDDEPFDRDPYDRDLDEDLDGADDVTEDDHADDGDDGDTHDGAPRRTRPGVDEVDERMERLERRRARVRSRRVLVAWILVVVLMSVAAAMVGWSIGLPSGV